MNKYLLSTFRGSSFTLLTAQVMEEEVMSSPTSEKSRCHVGSDIRCRSNDPGDLIIDYDHHYLKFLTGQALCYVLSWYLHYRPEPVLEEIKKAVDPVGHAIGMMIRESIAVHCGSRQRRMTNPLRSGEPHVGAEFWRINKTFFYSFSKCTPKFFRFQA